MATKLIKLEDGTLIEVEVPPGQSEQISGGLANKVDATLDKIKPIMVKVCHAVNGAWNEINQELNIEQAEVEMGLSFEGEGNLYVTKSKAGANLIVKLMLKPRNLSQ
ncbi:MAG: CU044_2847 family protein [bacterium]